MKESKKKTKRNNKQTNKQIQKHTQFCLLFCLYLIQQHHSYSGRWRKDLTERFRRNDAQQWHIVGTHAFLQHASAS